MDGYASKPIRMDHLMAEVQQVRAAHALELIETGVS